MESPHLRVKKRQWGWNKEKAQPPPPPLPPKASKGEGCGGDGAGDGGGSRNTGRGFRQYPLLIRPARDVEWITRVHSQQLSSSNRSII